VASDVVSFLEGWFRRYPQHRRKDLYVFGES
jgi:carboxypeptidase C (cathepsin A)